ncbi:MAG: rod shape-determining protein MreC [Oscillospiraceae bacterium]|nr:rod shape-determining protein MreC [Oscillospiraceae bacterium]
MKWIMDNKLISAIVLATIILLTVLAFTTGERARANWGSDGVQMILRPFEQAFTWTTKGVGGFFMHFGDIDKLREENRILAEQLAKAEEEAREITIYRDENEELRASLNLASTLKSDKTIVANIISKDFSNYYSSFKIDKGSKDGIVAKKSVRTPAGLVGYVKEVGYNWAIITTVLNSENSVSGIVGRTGEAVICKGDFALAKSGKMRISYVSDDTSLVRGDIIQTSGLGGIYPKGILIGTVDEIHTDRQSVSVSAALLPAVDLDKISVVLVETNNE